MSDTDVYIPKLRPARSYDEVGRACIIEHHAERLAKAEAFQSDGLVRYSACWCGGNRCLGHAQKNRPP